MDSWVTIEVSIKFEDFILDSNTESRDDFIEGTKKSIGESLNVKSNDVKINMIKQEQPLWFDDINLEDKAEA